ncbi:cytochrome P450 [Lentzea flava]|nr:cytochrome P450 [Lentzea flava]MCP2204010.1 Cytochrome P450 [Lentzea flava]
MLRADPTLIDSALNEVLRFSGPLLTPMFRFTIEQVNIGGTVIPSREIVLISLAAANCDPAKFPEPDRFRIDRSAQCHLCFGHGMDAI